MTCSKRSSVSAWINLCIVTGKVNKDLSVNVDGRIQLGENQIKNVQKSLPGGFYETISGKMKTMVDGKKGMTAGKKIVPYPEATYAGALALQHVNNPEIILKSYSDTN